MIVRFVACLSMLAYGFAADAARAEPIPLRIVTFNTELGIADTPQRREASGNQLTTLDFDGGGPNTGLHPDILCLQETRAGELNSFRDDYLPGYQVWRGLTQDPGGNAQAFLLRPDLVVRDFREFDHGGPRRNLRIILDVPETASDLVCWCVHFKAFDDPDSVATRMAEANALANRVASDRVNGIDLNNDGSPELFPTYYVVAGDLNQDDFSGTTIDSLLLGGSNGLDPGLNDARVESLLGAQAPGFVGGTQSTRFGLDSRLDYILVSDAIYAEFDLNGNGVWSQAELNSAGFVYVSADDNGQQASGDIDATSVASDHAPVVIGFELPGSGPCVGDTNGDRRVDNADLQALLDAWAAAAGDPRYNPAADFDSDGVVGNTDLQVVLDHWADACP
jgi:endonuclease/exonuclease/phosphatase family metal-dependent hydrolase